MYVKQKEHNGPRENQPIITKVYTLKKKEKKRNGPEGDGGPPEPIIKHWYSRKKKEEGGAKEVFWQTNLL